MKCKKSVNFDEKIIDYAVIHACTRTTLESRLASNICELCGKTDVPLEMHHVNKLKNLQGKDAKQSLYARNVIVRYTTLEFRKLSNNGEPDTSRGVSPVLREVWANLSW